MSRAKLPPCAPVAAGAVHPPDLERLLPVLRSALADLLSPVWAELEHIREALQTQRKPHYTVAEVAKLTGRTPYTVRRWITDSKIKAIRISGTGPKGRLLISREELDTLIAVGMGGHVA